MFIMLTQLNGKQILVNADHIETVVPMENGSRISMLSKEAFDVSESMEVIISMISEDQI